MSSTAIGGVNILYQALVQANIPLPEEVVSLDLRATNDGLVQLHVVCNLTGPMLYKLGQAMQVLAVKERLT